MNRCLKIGSTTMLLSTILWASQGVCEIDRIDAKKAKASIEAILASEPANVTCMLQLSNIYLKQGNIAKGFEILVEAYSIDPHRVQQSPIAEILPFALKVSALKRQAIRTNDKELWQKLGDGYFEMGIYNEAIDMYKKSLLVDENQSDVRIKLALVFQKNDQAYSAIGELKHVLAADFENFYAHYYMGKILMHTIQSEQEAKRYFQKAKALWLAHKESIPYVEYATYLSDLNKELGE